MHSTKAKYINELLSTENDHLKKLNEIVLQSIEQEKLLLESITQEQAAEKLSFGQRMADKVARFGGSWKFITWFMALLITWIVVNLLLISRDRFDPYPFILLNLVLSCLAAIQAPVIMMSQNRQAAIDRQSQESDYAVNRKAELEIELLHQKIDLLRSQEIERLIRIIDELAQRLPPVR